MEKGEGEQETVSARWTRAGVAPAWVVCNAQRDCLDLGRRFCKLVDMLKHASACDQEEERRYQWREGGPRGKQGKRFGWAATGAYPDRGGGRARGSPAS